MAFNGTEGAPISISEGAQLTQNFRNNMPNQPIAQFVGRKWLEALLAQEGAEGIRIYNGMDEEGNIKPVMVAANAQQNDVLDLIVDQTFGCPSYCPTIPNPLNS